MEKNIVVNGNWDCNTAKGLTLQQKEKVEKVYGTRENLQIG